MANERGAGQKLIPIPASEDFIKELNSGFKKAGYDNRSQFIRDAILEKLARLGIDVPEKLALAPDRLGKGGRPKINHHGASRLGEASSKTASAAAKLLRKGAASVLKRDLK
ncbi:MAG: ribbon-helix-helix domain-containing protein [Verrucomicrobiota bacterium]